MEEPDQTLILTVEGFHCKGCAEKLATHLEKVQGVRAAAVSFATREARIEYDPRAIAEARIIDEIQKSGFRATGNGTHADALSLGRASAAERSWKATLLSIPAMLASVIPTVTCPLCVTAYTALLSTLGLGFLMSSGYLLLLTIALLAVAITAMGYEASKRRSWGPFVLCLCGSVVILVGKFLLGSEATTYSGVALLLAASMWNLMPRLRSFRIGRIAA